MLKVQGAALKLIFIQIVFFSALNVQAKESRVDRLPFYETPSFTPVWLEKGDKRLKKFHKIPKFELTNQKGEKVTEKTFDGKVYATNFFFTTCPGICPTMKTNLSVLQKEFKKNKDVLLVSHSVTPTHDTVKVLKSYAKKNKIKSDKWHLLTGSKELIYRLGRKFYFVEEDLGYKKSDKDFLHTENVILIDQQRHIRGVYNGLNKASMQQLIADIKLLVKER